MRKLLLAAAAMAFTAPAFANPTPSPCGCTTSVVISGAGAHATSSSYKGGAAYASGWGSNVGVAGGGLAASESFGGVKTGTFGPARASASGGGFGVAISGFGSR